MGAVKNAFRDQISWTQEAAEERIGDLERALADCVSRLRSCARLHGNADWAVDALCEQFERVLNRPAA